MSMVCRTDRVTLLDTYQFNDSANDVFQREPYCVKFNLHDTGELYGVELLQVQAARVLPHHFLAYCSCEQRLGQLLLHE